MQADRIKAFVFLMGFLLFTAAGLTELQPEQIRAAAVRLVVGAPSEPAPIAGPPQIGRIKIVSGPAWVIHGGQHLSAEPGVQVYQGDSIETGPDGSIGITLVDDTMFSAGPNSQLALPEFKFDVDTQKGSILAELQKGTLAVVSGEITHETPGAMTIKTPSSILGVRGTTFALEVGAAAEESAAQERYVVLPNADGRPDSGAITVTRGDAATTLDQPYAAAELRDGQTASVTMDEEQAQAIFHQALAARPAFPAHFRLNFQIDSDQMTPESAADYPAVIADIKKRQVFEVELIGYTDTLADETHNKRLSLERANAIRRALIKDGVDAKLITAEGRGQTELLVPEAKNVGEPRNRRVEVNIR